MRPDIFKVLRESNPNTTPESTYLESKDLQKYQDSYIPSYDIVSDESQYDEGITPGTDIGQIRGQRQPWSDKLGNGLINLLGTGSIAAAEGFAGLVYGIPRALGNTTDQGYDPSLEKLYNNELGQSLDTIEEQMRQAFPFYKTDAETKQGLLRDLGSANFWYDTALGGLGYTIGSLVGGYGLGAAFKLTKAGVNGKLARIVDRASKVKEENIMQAFNTQERITAGKQFAVGLIVGAGEASKEARQTYKSLIDQGASEDEAAALANVNYVSNLFINGSINTALLGKFARPGMKDVLSRNTIKKNAEGVFEEVSSLAKRFPTATSIGKGSFLEGVQEGGQFFTNASLQDYYRIKRDNPEGIGLQQALQAMSEGFSETFGTKEGLENILVGALVGGLVGGVITRKTDKQVQAQRDANTATALEILNNDPKFKDLKEKFSNSMRVINHLSMAQEARDKGDAFTYYTAKESALINFALAHIQSGTTDLLKTQLEDIANMDDQNFKEFMGYAPTDVLQQGEKAKSMTDLIKRVEKIENVYKSVSGLFPFSSFASEDHSNVALLRHGVSYFASMAEDMDKREQDLSIELTDLLRKADLSGLTPEEQTDLFAAINYGALRAAKDDSYRETFNKASRIVIPKLKEKDSLYGLQAEKLLEDLNKVATKREDFIGYYNKLINLKNKKDIGKVLGVEQDKKEEPQIDEDEAVMQDFYKRSMEKGYNLTGEANDLLKDGVVIKVVNSNGEEVLYRIVKDPTTGKLYSTPFNDTSVRTYPIDAQYIRSKKPEVLSIEEYTQWLKDQKVNNLYKIWTDAISQLSAEQGKNLDQIQLTIDHLTEKILAQEIEVEDLTTLIGLVPEGTKVDLTGLLPMADASHRAMNRKDVLEKIRLTNSLIEAYKSQLNELITQRNAIEDLLTVLDQVSDLKLSADVLEKHISRSKSTKELVNNIYNTVFSDLEQNGIDPTKLSDARDVLEEKISLAEEKIKDLTTYVQVLQDMIKTNDLDDYAAKLLLEKMRLEAAGNFKIIEDMLSFEGYEVLRTVKMYSIIEEAEQTGHIANITDLAGYQYDRVRLVARLKEYVKLFQLHKAEQAKLDELDALKKEILVTNEQIRTLKEAHKQLYLVSLLQLLDSNYDEVISALQSAEQRLEKIQQEATRQIEVFEEEDPAKIVQARKEESAIKRFEDIFSTSSRTIEDWETPYPSVTTNIHQLNWAKAINAIPPVDAPKYKVKFIIPSEKIPVNGEMVPFREVYPDIYKDIVSNMGGKVLTGEDIFTLLIGPDGKFVTHEGRIIFSGYKLLEHVLPADFADNLSLRTKFRLVMTEEASLLRPLLNPNVSNATLIKGTVEGQNKEQSKADWIREIDTRVELYRVEYREMYRNSREAIKSEIAQGNPAIVSVNKLSRGIPIYDKNDPKNVLDTFNLKLDTSSRSETRGAPIDFKLEVATDAGISADGKIIEAQAGKVYLIHKDGRVIRLQNRRLVSQEIDTVLAILKEALPVNGPLQTSFPIIKTVDAADGKIMEERGKPIQWNKKKRTTRNTALLPQGSDKYSLITNLIYYGTTKRNTKGKIFIKGSTKEIIFMDPDTRFATETKVTVEQLHNPESPEYKKLIAFLKTKYININQQLLNQPKNYHAVPEVGQDGRLTGTFKIYTSYEEYLLDGPTSLTPLVTYITRGEPKLANRYAVFPVHASGVPQFDGTASAAPIKAGGGATSDNIDKVAPGNYTLSIFLKAPIDGIKPDDKDHLKVDIFISPDKKISYRPTTLRKVVYNETSVPKITYYSPTVVDALFQPVETYLYTSTAHIGLTTGDAFKNYSLEPLTSITDTTKITESLETASEETEDLDAVIEAASKAAQDVVNPLDQAEELPGVDLKITLQDSNYVKGNYENAVLNLSRILGVTPVKIQGLINGKSFGRFLDDGTILLSDILKEGTEYHEAFHRVFRWYLDPSERNKLYKEFLSRSDAKSLLAVKQEVYPEATEEELIEEVLAEEFREYALTGQAPVKQPKKLNFFQKLLAFLQELLNFITGHAEFTAQNLFENILIGEYKGKTPLAYRNRLKGSADAKITINEITLSEQTVYDLVSSLNFSMLGLTKKTEGLIDYYKLIEGKTVIDENFYKKSYIIDKQSFTLKGLISAELSKSAASGNLEAARILPLLTSSEFWNTIAKEHAKFLNKFGVRVLSQDVFEGIDPESDNALIFQTEKVKDYVYSKSAMDYDPSMYVKQAIRLLLASIQERTVTKNAEGKTVIVPKRNSLGLGQSTNFSHLFDYLGKNLAKTPHSIGEFKTVLSTLIKQAEKERHFVRAYELRTLLKDLEATEKADTSATIPNKLLTDFVVSFSNTIYVPGTTLIQPGNQIYTINSQSATNVKRVLSDWKNNLYAQKIDGGFGSTSPEQLRSKIIQSSSTTEVAALLGMNLTFPLTTPIKSATGSAFTAESLITAIRQAIISRPAANILNLYNPKSNPFEVYAYLQVLAEEQAKHLEVENLQHFDGKGNLRYALNLNTFFTTTADTLSYYSKNGALTEDQLNETFPHLATAYTRNSLILDILMGQTDEELYIGTAEDLKDNSDGTTKDNRSLTLTEKASQILNDTLSGKYHFIQTGDRSVSNTFHFKHTKLFIDPEAGSTVKQQTMDRLRLYLADEVMHIAALTSGVWDDTMYYLDKKGNPKVLDFRFFSSLNSFKTTLLRLYQQNGRKALEGYIFGSSEITAALDNMLSTRLSAYQKFLASNGIGESFKETGEGEALVTKYSGVADELISQYGSLDNVIELSYYNQLVSNIEQSKIFFGDFAFFKDSAEIFKRLSMFNSTKLGTIADIDNYIEAHDMSNTFVIEGTEYSYRKKDYRVYSETIFKDESTTLSDTHLELYRQALDKALALEFPDEKTRTAETEKYLKAYKDIKEADGLGYINIYAYRALLIRTSSWSEDHQKIFDKVVKGHSISPSEIYRFTMLKPQYTGYYNPFDSLQEFKDLDESHKVFIPAGRKTAYLPLIPQLFQKGSTLEKLNNTMLLNGIDIVHFDSAAKYGVKLTPEGTLNAFYTDGSFNSDSQNYPLSSLDARLLGIQQEIHNTPEQRIPHATQTRKINLSNIFESGHPLDPDLGRLAEEYITVDNEIVSRELDHMLRYIGAVEVPLSSFERRPNVATYYRITNIEEFVKILLDAAQDRNSPQNVIDSINSILITPEERDRLSRSGILATKSYYPIDALQSRNKVEQILMSVIRNRITFQKRKGQALPQSSIKGHETTSRAYSTDAKLIASDVLRPYIPLPGKTLPAEVMIPLPDDLATWASGEYGSIEAGLAQINKLIQRDENDNFITEDSSRLGVFLREFVKFKGLRIPNQSMASNDPLIIKEFLHPINSTIIVPNALLAKTGGDFDIDKVFMYLKNYNLVVSNKIVYPEIVSYNIDNNPYKLARQMVFKGKETLDTSYNSDFQRFLTEVRIKDTKAYERILKAHSAYHDVRSREKILKFVAKHGLKEDPKWLELETKRKDISSRLKNLLDQRREDPTIDPEAIETFAILDESQAVATETAEFLKEKIGITDVGDTMRELLVALAELENKLLKEVTDYIKENPHDNPMFYYGREALENKLLDLELEILQHSAVQGDLLTPTVDHVLKEYADKHPDRKKADSLTLSEIFEPSTSLTKFRDFMGGDLGIGIAALHISSHVRAQLSGLRTNLKSYFPDHNGDLGKIRSVSNSVISNSLSMLISSQVDIGKDPYSVYLGINSQTLDLACYLLRRGVSEEMLYTFLRHPVIEAYVKEDAINSSLTHRSTGWVMFASEEEGLEDKDLLKRINDSSKSGLRLSKRAVALKALRKVGVDLSTTVFLKTLAKNAPTLEIEPLTLEDLTSTDAQTVTKVLDVFLQLKKDTDVFRKLVSSTGADTQTDKSSNSSEFALQNIKELREEGQFENLEEYIHRLIGPYQKARELQLNLGLETKISGLESFKQILDAIFSTLAYTADGIPKIGDARKASLRTVLEEDLNVYLLSEVGLLRAGDFERLLEENPNSLAKQIARIKASPNHPLYNNRFIQQLLPIVNNASKGIDNISMYKTSLTTPDIDLLSADFEAIALYDKQAGTTIHSDLIKLNLLQAGVSTTPYSYMRLLPNDYWANYEFTNREGNPMKVKEVFLTAEQYVLGFRQNFIDAFYLNHPEFLPKSFNNTNSPYIASYSPVLKRHTIRSKQGTFTSSDPKGKPNMGDSIYYRRYYNTPLGTLTVQVAPYFPGSQKSIDEDASIDDRDLDASITPSHFTDKSSLEIVAKTFGLIRDKNNQYNLTMEEAKQYFTEEQIEAGIRNGIIKIC